MTSTPDKSTADPIGLYLHVPFCTNKCGYCDFNSWEETRRGPQKSWLNTLKRQADHWREHWAQSGKAVSFDTVFFGGGTPSLLEPETLLEVGTLVREMGLAPGAEFTVESNPETLTRGHLDVFREMGANRISVGVQSFDDTYLERLERKARRTDNIRALEMLQSEWKGPWSLDLMFALPAQTRKHWSDTLDLALQFQPSHLSAYQLTLTTERSKNWQQGGEEDLLAFFDTTEEKLEAAGLARYEVSNFARPGFECRHNLKYWRLEPFLGIGPGGSGLLPASLVGMANGAESAYGYHQKNPAGLEAWDASALSFAHELQKLHPRSALDHVFEMLMMGLRLREGLQKLRMGKFGSALELAFERQIKTNHINSLNDSWVSTPLGLRVLDTLLPQVYAEFEKNLEIESVPNLDLTVFDPKFSL